MSHGNGILCLALTMAFCTLAPGIGQAKPPDLPVDPRIVCPEGRDGPPRLQIPPVHGRQSNIEEEEITEPPMPSLPTWQFSLIAETGRLLQLFLATQIVPDDDFREMLRSTEPLDLVPHGPVGTEV